MTPANPSGIHSWTSIGLCVRGIFFRLDGQWFEEWMGRSLSGSPPENGPAANDPIAAIPTPARKS